MIDDKAQEAIREAYEKTILTEGKEGQAFVDAVVRFMIGDRDVALNQLKKMKDVNLVPGVGAMASDDARSYNLLVRDLYNGIYNAIRNQVAGWTRI